ncbi:hypothetical protein A9Q87_06520 [Flavobacteriales bacterium 34_180_T64]|nr:hypothetical protein A9Q87_06520 [Flavobacteriales bacterium 34_180_T64]
MKKETRGYMLLILLGMLAILALLKMNVINQNEEYHMFSDGYTLFSIPNFWNVISNVPIAVVGFIGLIKLKFNFKSQLQYFILFSGIILVAMGSSFYHMNPNSQSLIWDRLPMTVVFMTICSIIISEFIDDNAGRKILIPILIVGLLSVVYWSITNDLRPYVFVQFYPLLVIPIVLVCFKSRFNTKVYYWLLLIIYGLAKILEQFDEGVYLELEIISGHSLKHVCSAIGLAFLLIIYQKRKKGIVLETKELLI